MCQGRSEGEADDHDVQALRKRRRGSEVHAAVPRSSRRQHAGGARCRLGTRVDAHRRGSRCSWRLLRSASAAEDQRLARLLSASGELTREQRHA